MKLTLREQIALRFMDTGRMWSSHTEVGSEVWEHLTMRERGGSSLPGIGAAVLGSLRKKGLAYRLSDNRMVALYCRRPGRGREDRGRKDAPVTMTPLFWLLSFIAWGYLLAWLMDGVIEEGRDR
jgi:hypothetical protein